MTYQPGDVVYYETSLGSRRFGVVTAEPPDTGVAHVPRVWAFWDNPEGPWGGPYWVGLSRVRPAPNPDPIRARYIAWRLTQ